MAGRGGIADWEEKTRLTSGPSVVQPRRDRAYLVVLQGPHIGEMYPLEKDETIIGRSNQCDVHVTGEGISRQHARIVREGDHLVLEDMGSTNGTFANGSRVSRHELIDGDKVSVGEATVFKFAIHDQLDESFQRHMYESALRDGLTRIFNKKYFLDRLDAEFAFSQRHRVPLTLIIFDIDHFKRINDTHGHLVGDAVLQQLAAALGQTMRQEDVFARYGGEEFAVICRDVSVASSQAFAERLRATASGVTVQHEGQPVRCTISLGLAALPDETVHQPVELIERADGALYQAKRAGRNRVVVAQAGAK